MSDPLRPRPAEPTVEGRLAELDALRATLARVEALRVKWETCDVRLSHRIAANELRRAMDGEGTTCGVRAPSSEDGYCPCAREAVHEPPHRCVHGDEWDWRATNP